MKSLKTIFFRRFSTKNSVFLQSKSLKTTKNDNYESKSESALPQQRHED